jgi:hypothetical protein
MPEYKVPMSLVRKLRRFLQDYKEANELIQAEESPDTFLAEMLVDAVHRYNLIEPSGPGLDIAIDSLTGPEALLVIDEAAARTLTSVSIRMQRNMLDVTDGNTRKMINDKWQFYNTTIARLRGGDAGNGFDKLVKELKINRNCDLAWGVVPSELWDGYRVGGTGYISVIV